MLLQLSHMNPVGPQRQNSRQSHMGQDKAKLLRALAIDRGEDRPVPAPRAWPRRLFLGLAGLIALLAAAWTFLPQLRGGGPGAESASTQTEAVRSPQKPALPSANEPAT